MSKIIKASQIIGKYKLSNVHEEEIEKQNQPEETSESKENQKTTEEQQEEKAKKIIEEAEEKAKKIIEEAKAEEAKVEKIKEEAYQEGYQKGKEEGYQEIKQNMQFAIDSLNEEIAQLKDQYEKELNQLKPQIINIATKMAGKIINHKIEHIPEVINNIVEDVMGDLSNNHQEFVININSEMLPYLNKSDLKTSFPESNFKFNTDDSLKKGDVVINTNFGGKDAYLNEKLGRLETQIKKEMGMNS